MIVLDVSDTLAVLCAFVFLYLMLYVFVALPYGLQDGACRNAL